MIDLNGRAIAITGASSGIGAATARACAAAGMPVALMARRADQLERVAEQIRAAGGRAIAVPGSAEVPDDGQRLIDATRREFGSVYAVFANAGYGIEAPTLDTDEAEWRRMFEVNFWGSLNVVRPAVAAMRAAKQATGPTPGATPGQTPGATGQTGHVLFCSSCLSKLGLPMYAAYCASKAAQDHFGRAMRHELAGEGIAVSTVHPIGTKTEFFDRASERSPAGLRLMERSREAFMQPPERVAAAVVQRLRRGRGGEVWTSLTVRLTMAANVAMPGLTDAALARMYRARLTTRR